MNKIETITSHIPSKKEINDIIRSFIKGHGTEGERNTAEMLMTFIEGLDEITDAENQYGYMLEHCSPSFRLRYAGGVFYYRSERQELVETVNQRLAEVIRQALKKDTGGHDRSPGVIKLIAEVAMNKNIANKYFDFVE